MPSNALFDKTKVLFDKEFQRVAEKVPRLPRLSRIRNLQNAFYGTDQAL